MEVDFFKMSNISITMGTYTKHGKMETKTKTISVIYI